MYSVKFHFERCDNSFNSEVWKIRTFRLKNCIFKEENNFTLHESSKSDTSMCGRFWPFQNIFENVFRYHIWVQFKFWDSRYTSEPILHIILKHIKWIYKIRIFVSKKIIFFDFSMFCKHFLRNFEGFWWSELKKSIFSKSNDNIKRVVRKI